jgi:hypothetical protein
MSAEGADGVFRKLPQLSVSLAAPHPGYSISEDRVRYCRSDGSAQYLLEAADSIITYIKLFLIIFKKIKKNDIYFNKNAYLKL